MRPLALSSEEETETQRGEGLAVRSPSQLIGGSWTWGRAFWLYASSRWGVPEATCSPSASQGTVKEGARVAPPPPPPQPPARGVLPGVFKENVQSP